MSGLHYVISYRPHQGHECSHQHAEFLAKSLEIHCAVRPMIAVIGLSQGEGRTLHCFARFQSLDQGEAIRMFSIITPPNHSLYDCYSITAVDEQWQDWISYIEALSDETKKPAPEEHKKTKDPSKALMMPSRCQHELYDPTTGGYRCTSCYIDMGPNNPRQLCGKWRCLDPQICFICQGVGVKRPAECSNSNEIIKKGRWINTDEGEEENSMDQDEMAWRAFLGFSRSSSPPVDLGPPT